MIRLIKHWLRSWGPNGDRPEMWAGSDGDLRYVHFEPYAEDDDLDWWW